MHLTNDRLYERNKIGSIECWFYYKVSVTLQNCIIAAGTMKFQLNTDYVIWLNLHRRWQMIDENWAIICDMLIQKSFGSANSSVDDARGAALQSPRPYVYSTGTQLQWYDSLGCCSEHPFCQPPWACESQAWEYPLLSFGEPVSSQRRT